MPTLPRSSALVLAACAAGLLGVVAVPVQALAAPSDVVISELHYHSPDASPAVEFLELTNSGGAPVDISGWSFSAGITLATPDLAFPAGTVLTGGERIALTSDQSTFTAAYGSAADFSFAGTGLSNGGEQVTLVDAAAVVVDDVLYDDAPPWSVAPDGAGPSLELTDLAADNSQADAWAASLVDGGTPRAPNSVEGTPQATVTQVTATPNQPGAGAPVQVSARLSPATTATMTYKVMEAAAVTVPMADDTASPGGAGDGVFAATIPGGAAGDLLRYRIDAARGSALGAHPPVGDSRPYDGVVVTDPELGSAQFPVLQMFMSDAVYQDLVANHRCDGYEAQVAFAYGTQVLDGAAIRIKGHSSCSDAKAKWNVELPGGYAFDFGAPFPYPLDEFDLQSEAVPTPRIGWEMIGQTGEATVGYQTMRVQRQGSFFGVYGVIEEYDNRWRAANGYGDAGFYKVEAGGLRTYATPELLAASGDIEKKNPDDDLTDIWELTQVLARPSSASKRAWIREHVDVPQMVNYMAVTVAMRHWDSGGKNYYLAQDPQTGRWQAFSWDLDGIFSAGSDTKGDFVIPDTQRAYLWQGLLEDPQILAMHYRRVRELHDQFLVGNGLVTRFDQLTTPYAADIARDVSAWGTPKLSNRRTKMVNGVQERRDQIASHTRPNEVPPSQSAAPAVVVNEINYAPAAGGAEYLEIYNPSATESVDMSHWQVGALGDGYAVAPGTVLLPRSYLVWTRSDHDLVQRYGGDRFVAGQYPGALADEGEAVTVLDGSRVVDSVTYSPSPPWPDVVGNDHSLELTDPSSDNALPASWVASPDDGSPGEVNGAGPPPGPVTLVASGASWRYLATGTAPSTWRDRAFDDSGWSGGAAPLGFKNPVQTSVPATAGRVTYYFRTSFTVPAGTPTGAPLTLRLLRDDGAVVHLNGSEVARSNMPTGTVTASTKASAAVNGAAETQYVQLTIPAGALTVGTNVLAIEVHQKATGAAADLSLDAELLAGS